MVATLSSRVDMAEAWPDAIKVEEYKGYTIAIVPDSTPTNPREWSTMGEMITWERKYISPDKNSWHFRQGEDMTIYLRELCAERHSKDDPGVIVLPLYRGYDGELRAGDQVWDLGKGDDYGDDDGAQGAIMIWPKEIRKEWDCKRITRKTRANVIECLQGEVKTYSLWATGQVFGFVVGDAEDEHIDSCWGFISWEPDGDDYALAQGKEAVDGLIARGRMPVIAAQDDAEDIDEY